MLVSLLQSLKKILPSGLYYLLIGRWNTHGFERYFWNTGWLTLAKIVTFIVSFFTLALVARYLGPENFGKLSYAQSFVAIFSVFASLSIDQILYRNLIAYKDQEHTLIGTAIGLKLLLGTVTLASTISAAWLINDEPLLTWLTGLIALSFIFQPWSSVAHVFAATVRSKYTAYATILISILIPLLKIFVVLGDQGVLWLAGIISIEALLYAAINLYIYLQVFHRSWRTWQFSWHTASTLLRYSWPLAAASLTGYIYGRIDQIMIQHLRTSFDVGLYDTAVRLTELVGYFPGILVASLLPALMNARSHNRAEYRRRWRALTTISLGIAGSCAAILFFAAPLIVTTIFGPEFSGASDILRIYVWSTLGTISLMLAQQYLIAEERTVVFFVISIGGMITNVVLNWYWIPVWGALGAAYATLTTLALMVLLFALWRTYTHHHEHS